MQKVIRFGFALTPLEKDAISKLAELEGGLSQAALIRRLIHKAASAHGISLEANNCNEKTTINQIKNNSIP